LAQGERGSLRFRMEADQRPSATKQTQPSAMSIKEALRYATPSALTIGALVSGLSAVRFASEESFGTSVSCVLMACVLDGLDGHVARYLNASTMIGFELDSLCDCANFGVVPVLVVFFWAKTLPAQDCRSEACVWEHTFLWIACCCYSACCALRLARFNVQGHAAQMDQSHLKPSDQRRRPSVPKAVKHNFLQKKLYFQGVPAPIGAAYALTPMMLHFSATSRFAGTVGDVGAWAIGRRGTAALLIATAILMVSPLPTFSSKMLKIDSSDSFVRSRSVVSRITKGFAGLVLCYLFLRFPFDVVLLLNLVHFFSIPLSAAVYYRCAFGKDE